MGKGRDTEARGGYDRGYMFLRSMLFSQNHLEFQRRTLVRNRVAEVTEALPGKNGSQRQMSTATNLEDAVVV